VKYRGFKGCIAMLLLLSLSTLAMADDDSDFDGIPDSIEGDSDPDADGIPNYLDLDSDGDGQLDALEAGDNPNEPRDTDGDGIPDYLDLDSDNDGLPDSVEYGTQDTDNDGIPDNQDPDSDNDHIPDSVEGDVNTDGDVNPNYIDWDSDNDTIPDRAEYGSDPNNPVDTDTDGMPDYIDTDSDNDGIPDSVEGLNDADFDGVFSYIDTDSDNDGIPDSVEGVGDDDGDGIPNYLDAPLNESNIDTDGDGWYDADDRDDDNDGLMDFQENMLIDSDGDGVYDSKDLDSDNDAICDAHEGGHFDVPEDCRFEVTNPDNFGIPDIVSNYPLSVFDTDDDGIPNLLDIDSDDDGLFDLTENGGFDIDNNGLIDRFIDENGDGKDDTAPSLLIDLDQDSIPDYIDPFIGFDDSNGPNGGSNQPGSVGTTENSTQDTPPAFETSVNGYGGGCSVGGLGNDPLLVLMIILSVIVLSYKSRRKYVAVALAALSLQACAISNNPGTFKQSLYFATGVGVSRLAPEPRSDELRVTDSTDRSNSITVGADLTRDFAIEFASHVLGESEIGEAGTIAYDVAPTISVLRYMFRDPVKQRLRVGFSGFGRLGSGIIENEAEVNLKKNNVSTIVVGLGMEYIFYNGIGIRAEVQSFDSDAQSATVGLTYRFGIRPKKPEPVKPPTNRTYIPPKVARPPAKRY